MAATPQRERKRGLVCHEKLIEHQIMKLYDKLLSTANDPVTNFEVFVFLCFICILMLIKNQEN
jgi:hypothetical protein